MLNIKRAIAVVGGMVLAASLSPARADLQGSTYDFTASATGSTQIAATNGTDTDPLNPGFCVGPPLGCATGAGVSGSFSFSDLTPTTATITFTFFGSTSGAGPGTFVIDLGNFLTTDGDTITNVTYSSGNLAGGSFSSVTWNGTDAVFTGSTGTEYNAIGGRTVVFNVTMAAAPEPVSLALLGTGLVGLGLARRRRRG